MHRGRVRSGEARVGDTAYAEVDVERRRAISRSHTATHLVHAGFRRALGESAAQAGSENSPGRFRFDFTASGAVPPSVLRDVEDEVNEVLVGDLDVRAFHTSIDEARAMGALALFGEVRRRGPRRRGRRLLPRAVRRHPRRPLRAARPGQGAGRVVHRPGVRRVEALVGIDAFRFLARPRASSSRSSPSR